MTETLDLFKRISGDVRRIHRQLSDDLLRANALLHNAAATDDEMAECLTLWCLHNQPCQFGRVAAKKSRIHFCILTEAAIVEWSESDIAQKISEEKRLWKQRAAFDPAKGCHSFVLVVASPHLEQAAPDKHLRAFSEHILSLAGWDDKRLGARPRNSVTSDFLYLKHPTDNDFYGFRFNIDFFACAGDGRWWHDHRFPGGIAFTANSTGHMMAAREWYQEKHDSRTWALTQAMFTIRNAMPTRKTDSSDPADQGRATWLRPLNSAGEPVVKRLTCPLSRVPAVLEGKDWTRYEGLLHTDHAIRAEFFQDREVAPTVAKPYLMDLTYLYDDADADFVKFTGGERFSAEQVFAEIGQPEDWTHRASVVSGRPRTDEAAYLVAQQLQACREWENAPRYDPISDTDL